MKLNQMENMDKYLVTFNFLLVIFPNKTRKDNFIPTKSPSNRALVSWVGASMLLT